MASLLRSLLKVHYACTMSLYIIFILCMFMNVYVLLSRDDTIYYLRIYHIIVGLLMVTCGAVMIEFLIRTRLLPKLDEPHEMPRPALIGAIALTIGIMVGYFYFVIFNYAFAACDKLVDALYGSELWLDSVYSALMIVFCALALVYILQRCYYGSINSNIDRVCRLWVNVTFSVLWVKIIVYKGYLSHQELCQRQELEGYWCPVIKRHYECDPAYDLKGTAKIWYYLNKGLLNGAIISCAAEFFPVMIIAHWLACGGAEEKAEDIMRQRQAKQGVRSLFTAFMKDISRVYTANENVNAPPLRPRRSTEIVFSLLAAATAVVIMIQLQYLMLFQAMIARWLVTFYYSIDFDTLIKKHWPYNDYVQLTANVLQVALFLGAYLWSRTVADDRLDAHHKAHARGDIIILFGCCIVLFIKLALQSVELQYQKIDGYIYESEAVMRIISLILVHVSQWMQYFAIRRLLALSDKDIRTTKRLLPPIGVVGALLAWIHFGVTFLDTSVIKYQLTDDKFRFHETTLINSKYILFIVCMIFTQTIFPADYLYAFTVSGCWFELLLRYLQIGYFQLGRPRLEVIHHHAHKQSKITKSTMGILNAAMAFTKRVDDDDHASSSVDTDNDISSRPSSIETTTIPIDDSSNDHHAHNR